MSLVVKLDCSLPLIVAGVGVAISLPLRTNPTDTQIIRAGDYADPALAALSVDAVKFWTLPEWEGTYHE